MGYEQIQVDKTRQKKDKESSRGGVIKATWGKSQFVRRKKAEKDENPGGTALQRRKNTKMDGNKTFRFQKMKTNKDLHSQLLDLFLSRHRSRDVPLHPTDNLIQLGVS